MDRVALRLYWSDKRAQHEEKWENVKRKNDQHMKINIWHVSESSLSSRFVRENSIFRCGKNIVRRTNVDCVKHLKTWWRAVAFYEFDSSYNETHTFFINALMHGYYWKHLKNSRKLTINFIISSHTTIKKINYLLTLSHLLDQCRQVSLSVAIFSL